MASLLGAAYDSSDDETHQTQPPAATKVVAAPEVNTEVWSLPFKLTSKLHCSSLMGPHGLKDTHVTVHGA